MISIAYADAAHSQVLVTDSEGVTRMVSSDWPGEFRMSNGVADVLVALGKAQPDPYVAPVKSADPASESLSMRQLRQGLRAFAGKPASFIQDTINKIPDPGARDDAQIWFEETIEVHWESPVTQSLVALAGFKSDEAAALWLKIAKEIPR